MNDIQIDGVSLNYEWVSSFTSVSEFIMACPPHILEGENRELKLTEIYNTVKPEVREEKPKKK